MEAPLSVKVQRSVQWEEVRIAERRPERRSNHAAVAFGNRLYVLGGKDMREDVKDCLWVFSEDLESWEEVKLSGTQPPCLCHHTAVQFQTLMVIFGGTDHQVDSDALYLIDLDQLSCERRGPANQFWPPPMDSHSAVLCAEMQTMVVFGGFVNGSRSNELFQLSLSTWQWSAMRASGAPAPRSGHSAVAYCGNMYVYGGTEEGGGRLCDFWELDVVRCAWRELRVEGTPEARSGHSACVAGDSMIVFGGCRDRTRETNEVYRYSFAAQEWELLIGQTEIADPVRIQQEGKSPMRASPTRFSPAASPGRTTSTPNKRPSFEASPVRKSPNAEVPPVPVQGRVYGSTPHPRDGHSAVLIRNKIYVFAGDRGQVPFNDLYALSL